MYLQALCYEIPNYSANPLIDDLSSFIVGSASLQNCTRKPFLISPSSLDHERVGHPATKF